MILRLRDDTLESGFRGCQNSRRGGELRYRFLTFLPSIAIAITPSLVCLYGLAARVGGLTAVRAGRVYRPLGHDAREHRLGVDHFGHGGGHGRRDGDQGRGLLRTAFESKGIALGVDEGREGDRGLAEVRRQTGGSHLDLGRDLRSAI